MIRFRGMETVPGYGREDVFAALLVKSNWPSVAGVHLGPESELLGAGGGVRAVLELPGVELAVTGSVTLFEPPSRIDASGTQAGIWAGTTVRMTDNADQLDGKGALATTVEWRFQARLPVWLAMFEFPASAAIRLAIPVIKSRFIANIVRYLDAHATGSKKSETAGRTEESEQV